jgi:phosphoribosylformylglycinamidine cyclo-ligase
MSDAYTQAGVDIEAGEEVVRRIKNKVGETHTKAVLTGIGSFGALYDLKEIFQKYEEPVLVQSIDGVGTKLIIARMIGVYDSVGRDIVNHSCNDIVAMGARPITFLDYVAHEKLVPEDMEKMVWGMAEACRENGVALVGGETAEMPGTYQKGEHDIAGCITGIVDRKKIVTGETIAPGDTVYGFASNGLHTNGYSLARKALFDIAGLKVDSMLPTLAKSVGETLLEPHLNYTNPVLGMIEQGLSIKGIAHITGGGFDNLARVLPGSVDAAIAKGSWPVLPIFAVIGEKGKIADVEMHQVFNMGIGMMIVVDAEDESKVEDLIKSYPSFSIYKIGKIEAGTGKVVIS